MIYAVPKHEEMHNELLQEIQKLLLNLAPWNVHVEEKQMWLI